MKKSLFAGFLLLLLVIAANAALSLVGLGDPVILESDNGCGYLVRPNQNHYRFFVHTRVNSKSMRSEEFPEPKSPGTYRLFFVGDSITYGTTRVDQKNIFTEVLNRELPSILNRKVEVLNASASAWAIGNELGYIRTRGIFQSDAVVLVLNDGDFSQKTSTPGDVGTQLYFSKPACALCELTSHYTRAQKTDQGTGQVNDPQQEQANLQNLDEFRNLISARKSKMLILFVPFRRNITHPGQQVLQPQLRSWAEAHNVPIADATPYLGRLTIPEASIDGGTHLSVQGNAAVAKAFENFEKAHPPNTTPAI